MAQLKRNWSVEASDFWCFLIGRNGNGDNLTTHLDFFFPIIFPSLLKMGVSINEVPPGRRMVYGNTHLEVDDDDHRGTPMTQDTSKEIRLCTQNNLVVDG